MVFIVKLREILKKQKTTPTMEVVHEVVWIRCS